MLFGTQLSSNKISVPILGKRGKRGNLLSVPFGVLEIHFNKSIFSIVLLAWYFVTFPNFMTVAYESGYERLF